MKSLRGITMAALLGLAGIVGLYVGSQVGAQQPGRPGPVMPNWRYQMAVDNRGTAYLLDTETGKAWVKYGTNNWEDTKSPAAENK